DVRNILDFERDYRNATVVKLEENYRSTQRILDAAHNVVRNNAARKEKKLWTDRMGGEPVVVVQAHDEHHEAETIAREIERPPRGIGAKGQAGLAAFAKARGVPIAAALLDAEQAPDIPKRQAAAMVAFGLLLGRMRDELLLKDLPEIVDEVIRSTGYGAYLKD